jgi:hypothetical protein
MKIRIGILLVLFNIGSIGFAKETSNAWLPITEQNLSIQAGSALDFSVLVESGVAGQHGRIIANANGHLAYTDNPNISKRFFCASQPHGAGGDSFPDHATADRYAKQVRLHGYNLARFHFVEHALMKRQSKDFVFNAEQLDRFYYFMAALKREGVYWLMDGLTSWNGAYGDVGNDRWVFKHDLKLGVYFDVEAQAHWRRLVQQVLNQVNPYTQLTPLQDPALMGVILVNESGLNHLINLSTTKPADRHKVDAVFRQWLTTKYGTLNKALATWGEKLDAQDILLPREQWTASERVKDSQLFYYEIQKITLQWMTQYLRNLGYQGLITAYNNWSDLQDSATRLTLDWVDMHDYHDEPSDWVSAGSTLKQQSSFSEPLDYVRSLATTRYWSKPFTVSEYDHPFWDSFRYESGLAVGAYSSFQDWDLICRHSGAIELAYGELVDGKTRTAIYPFDVGMDPIARASETLAALLFARHDVKTAAHKVAISLSPDYVFNRQAGIESLPKEIRHIALVTGLGLTWQQQTTEHFDLVIAPNGSAPTLLDKGINQLKNWLDLGDTDWAGVSTTLKQNQLLTEHNVSNNNGLFQSDTEEISLDKYKQLLTVSTAKTEAVAFTKTLPPPLVNLTITGASDPALLAISALDDSPLADSKRLLIIYATDAKNTGMTFKDHHAKVLKQLGNLPVLLKNSQITFSLHNNNAASLHLYALHLNGERAVELPIQKNTDNTLNIQLDLNAIRKTPTTYFELTMH